MRTETLAGETQAQKRLRYTVRIITSAIAITIIALAWFDDPMLGNVGGFSWFQIALLAIGLAVGAFAFAPVAWNTLMLTILISACLTLTIAEIVLQRILGPQFYGIYQFDDHILYRLIPNTQRVTMLPPINGSLRIQYSINSHGFRGEELASKDESLRVIVYGDSFIQGDFSQTKDLFTERLKTYLAQKTEMSVEVINAGVAGYGPDQELRRMESELPIFKPDLAIVAIYAGNDFGDIVRDKLYRLSRDGSLIENPYVALDASFPRDMERARNETILRKMLRNTLNQFRGNPDQNFPTGQEARRDRMKANLTQAIFEYNQFVIEGDNVVHELYRDPYTADMSLTPKSNSARYKITMMEKIIARMKQTASAQHVPLLFVLVPTPIDVTDEHESGEIDAKLYPEYRRTALTDTLEDICRRNQLPAVNLFGPFWEQRKSDLYLKGGDDHWNDRGQDFAAEIVSNFVTKQDMLNIQTKGTK